jgi:hypothetical protein
MSSGNHKSPYFLREKGQYFMNDKSEIHRNQTWPVFYGTQQCVKIGKDLVWEVL